MKEAMIVAGLVITILLTILYFVILYVWPEWVGISGKDSKKTLEDHQEEKKETD